MTTDLKSLSDTQIQLKRQLVDRLAELHSQSLANADILDGKAWEILRTTSAIFGIVTTLQVVLGGTANKTVLWIFIAIALVIYILQIIFVMLCIRPRNVRYVPGVGELSYENIVGKYAFNIDEETQLDKLIVDYAGRKETELEVKESSKQTKKEVSKIIPGVIQYSQQITEQKARWIRLAIVCMSMIVCLLVMWAVLYVGV